MVLTEEPEGYQFGKQVEYEGSAVDEEIKLISLTSMAPAPKAGNPIDPLPDKDKLNWGIGTEEIIQRQTCSDALPCFELHSAGTASCD